MDGISLKSNKDELIMPKLTFGAGGFEDYGMRDEYFKLLDIFYGELGGRSFDTARAYCIWKKGGEGVSERVLGEWIKARGIKRDEIIITTKGGFPYVEDYHRHRLDRDNLVSDIEDSLKTLGLDYVDIYLLHRDTKSLAAGEMIKTLNSFVKSGKTRFVGVSNWRAERIEEANDYAKAEVLEPISVSQINFSLARTTPERLEDYTAVCMDNIEYEWYLKNNFPVMAYSSQSKGYFSKLLSGSEMPDKCRKRFDTEHNRRIAERVGKLSGKKGFSVSQIALLYLIYNRVPTSAIFCPRTADQLKDSMGSMYLELDEDEIKFLEMTY